MYNGFSLINEELDDREVVDKFKEESMSVDDCRPETDPGHVEARRDQHSSLSTICHQPHEDDLTNVDTVVVGGGVSGLYCAYKLLKSKSCKKDILVIEQSDNLGGRLQSDVIDFDKVNQGKIHLVPDSGDSEKHECVKEEEGGMRFAAKESNVMPRLWGLINELNFKEEKDGGEIIPFPMKPDKGENSNRNSFNGKNFTEWYSKENPVTWSLLFDLDKSELEKSPQDICREIYKRVMECNTDKLLYYLQSRDQSWGRKELEIMLTQDVPGPDKTKINFVNLVQNPSYWQYVRTHFVWSVEGEDVSLRSLSMIALMVGMGYSSGCIQMLTQALGFFCLTLTRGNSGVVLQMMITNVNIHPDLWCFKYGFSVLTTKLANEIDAMVKGTTGRVTVDEEKGPIKEWRMTSTTVTNVSILPRAKGKAHGSYKIDVKSRTGEKLMSIRAKTVVLAIAADSFTDLFTKTSFIDPSDKHPTSPLIPTAVFNTVVGIRMVKINLFFDREWWNDGLMVTVGESQKHLYGPNTTNLPLGMVYPFYSFACHPENEDKLIQIHSDTAGKPAALTIYCDESNARFWSDLQKIGLFFSSELQTKYKNMQPASRPLVKEAKRQLGALFNYKSVPEPILTTFKDWNGNFGESKAEGCRKYNGYAIHQWKTMKELDDKTIVRKMVQPFGEQHRVFCCNEAWSDFQGWVEGSLTSSDLVLDAIKNFNPDVSPFPTPIHHQKY